jgi:hypothetical protein
MPDDFEPVLYLDENCPSCFKLRLFLLDSGLIGSFEQREFTLGDEREQSIRSELAPHFEEPRFPAVQYAPGKYLDGADAIIDHYAHSRKVDFDALRLYRTYVAILLPLVRRSSARCAEPSLPKIPETQA